MCQKEKVAQPVVFTGLTMETTRFLLSESEYRFVFSISCSSSILGLFTECASLYNAGYMQTMLINGAGSWKCHSEHVRFCVCICVCVRENALSIRSGFWLHRIISLFCLIILEGLISKCLYIILHCQSSALGMKSADLFSWVFEQLFLSKFPLFLKLFLELLLSFILF